MKGYYKIYHYSSEANLTDIHPDYYGTGVTQGSECKYGKKGLNKSYYYTQDKPEIRLRTAKTRYEIYLPYEWKARIYDTSKDPLHLYERVVKNFQQAFHRHPYHYESMYAMEEYIKALDYVGWTCSQHGQLPHAIVLFHALSTAKPDIQQEYIVYDWSGQVIEKHVLRLAKHKSPFSLFKPKLLLPEVFAARELKAAL